jgi:hypothetical protein
MAPTKRTARVAFPGGSGSGGKLEPLSVTAKAPTKQALLDELAQARIHLERRAFVNLQIAAWRDELRRRVVRAQHHLVLGRSHPAEDDFLAAEVREFKLRCREITAWRKRRERP